MKKSSAVIYLAFALGVLTAVSGITGCKPHSPIKYAMGTFPADTIASLTDINSAYDDFNSDLYELNGYKSLIFSSNRNSTGGQFDLVQGYFSYKWDQTNGNYTKESGITTDAFLTKLLTAANTSGNEYGPLSIYSPTDGYEYLICASDIGGSGLDFYYLKNRPTSGSTLPNVLGPFPATRLNTSSDDAYISFDTNQDTLYFSSARSGNFDIYIEKRSVDTSLTVWFNKPYRASVKVDSINSSTGDDKCPYVFRNMLVFASNRPGGLGGYDLYYSTFINGKWNSPINFGPKINTSYNEYRPVIGANNGFTNPFMIFSSDRPGGKGGYDLYFIGL